MDQRGQSALEYLMTYGWALVVIVIVVAALFAFGVFNTPSNCTQFGGRLLLKDFAIRADSIEVSIQNGSTGDMNITSVTPPTGFTTSNPTVATTLSRSGVQAVVVDGNVTSGTAYDIVVNYTANSITHTEKTTCTAGSV